LVREYPKILRRMTHPAFPCSSSFPPRRYHPKVFAQYLSVFAVFSTKVSSISESNIPLKAYLP
jgi:hypothetical protein